MAVFYLDASAIIKRYRSEQGTELIDELLDRPADADRFYTSFFSVLEVNSAIRRLAAAGQLNSEVAGAILAQFSGDVQDRLRLWPLNNEAVTNALGVVTQHRLRSGDAIHLATCLSLQPLATSGTTVMVTSDTELFNAAQAAGLTVLNPGTAGALVQLHGLREAR